MLAMLKYKWFEDCFKAMIRDDVIEIINHHEPQQGYIIEIAHGFFLSKS